MLSRQAKLFSSVVLVVAFMCSSVSAQQAKRPFMVAEDIKLTLFAPQCGERQRCISPPMANTLLCGRSAAFWSAILQTHGFVESAFCSPESRVDYRRHHWKRGERLSVSETWWECAPFPKYPRETL